VQGEKLGWRVVDRHEDKAQERPRARSIGRNCYAASGIEPGNVLIENHESDLR
jgi:hypothetical protein